MKCSCHLLICFYIVDKKSIVDASSASLPRAIVEPSTPFVRRSASTILLLARSYAPVRNVAKKKNIFDGSYDIFRWVTQNICRLIIKVAFEPQLDHPSIDVEFGWSQLPMPARSGRRNTQANVNGHHFVTPFFEADPLLHKSRRQHLNILLRPNWSIARMVSVN